MSLEGKGFYMWKINKCENGDTTAIVNRARDAGLTHLLIKIADGSRAYNVDLATPLVESLKAAGIKAWGWQFIYGDEPFREADIAAHRINTLGLDGFVVNAEEAYKGKHAAASAYMDALMQKVSGVPIGLSSFRYPGYHATFPWTEFLSHCDINMPQVYWLQADNPAQQLDRCISQFQNVYPVRPIIATGAAYEEFGWRPKPNEVHDLMQHAKEIGIPAVNFWSWDYAGAPEGRDLWEAIAAFDWPVAHPALDLVDTLVQALNSRDIDALVALYQPNAVLVTSKQTIQGTNGIRQYYTDLLTTSLPGAQFVLESRVMAGTIHNVKWDARNAANGHSVDDAQDTIGLRQGLIQYHSSVYQIL